MSDNEEKVVDSSEVKIENSNTDEIKIEEMNSPQSSEALQVRVVDSSEVKIENSNTDELKKEEINSPQSPEALQIEKLSKDNKNLKSKCKKLEEANRNLSEENKIVIVELQKINELIKSIQDQLEHADILLQEEREKSKNLSEELEKCKLQEYSIPTDLLDYQNKIDELKRKHEEELTNLIGVIEQEKKNFSTLFNEKQRLDDHLDILNIKLNSLQPLKNSAPKKDDLKREKMILEAIATKAANLEEMNKKLMTQLKHKEQKCSDLEIANAQKTAVVNLFLTELQNKIPLTNEYMDKFKQDDMEFLKNIIKKPILDIQTIAEKTFIENMRLKEDIKVLGDEISKLMNMVPRKSSDIDI